MLVKRRTEERIRQAGLDQGCREEPNGTGDGGRQQAQHPQRDPLVAPKILRRIHRRHPASGILDSDWNDSKMPLIRQSG